jgi:hypothetical protein
MEERFLFTKGCKVLQQVVLFCTAILLLIFLLFLFFQYSYSMLLLVFVCAAVTFFLNLFIGRIYEIRIEEKSIVIENMWRKAHYPLAELIDIRLVHFVVPYPFNPYLKFVLKNKEGYVGVIPNRMKYYLSGGGIGKYINNLKDKLIG